MIEPLNRHYSFVGVPSIHDEEAMTALELAGRIGAKVNEIVGDQNNLRTETLKKLNEILNTTIETLQTHESLIHEIRDVTVPNDVKKEIDERLENGDFDEAISKYMNFLNERVDNLLGSVVEGSTTRDAELIDIRTRANGFTHGTAGNSVRAIDEDLQTEKYHTHGTKTLFDHIGLMHTCWGGVYEGTAQFSTNGATNGAIATESFNNPKCKLYVRVNATSDRAFKGVLSVVKASDTSVLHQQNMTTGYSVYTIDCSLFSSVNDIQVVISHNGQGDSELTWTYTVHEISVETSVLRDLGYNKNYAYEYLVEHGEKLKLIDGMDVLFSDMNQCEAVWSTAIEDRKHNEIVFSGNGDKGIYTADIDINTGAMLRVSFDIELPANTTANLYVSRDMGSLTEVYSIPSSGHYDIILDPSYILAYTSVEIINYLVILHHSTSDVQTKVKNLTISQSKLLDAGLPDNLVEAIVQVNRNVALDGGTSTSTIARKQYMTGNDGLRYDFVVKDGQVIAVPVMSHNSVLIGNSLLSGFGWENFDGANIPHGMSASVFATGYAGLLGYGTVTGFFNSTPINMINGAEWENELDKGTGYAHDWLVNNLTSVLTQDTDNVIIQLGDNINTSNKIVNFDDGISDFVDFIRVHSPKARIFWVGAWYCNMDKLNIMKDTCQRKGINFINIWDLHTKDTESKVGASYYVFTDEGITETIISNEGVASHPSDEGMRLIANKILYEMGCVDDKEFIKKEIVEEMIEQIKEMVGNA